MSHYEILGVPYNADQRTIKKAYAALIKQYRPDSHPTEFARIRSAYEQALEQCRYREQYEYDDEYYDESETVSDTTDESIHHEDSIAEPIIQSVIEEAQTENNDDSFNRLVEKPMLQLPDEQPEIEHSGDRFSRLIDKPVIEVVEQIVNDHFSRLVDKPIVQEVTEPDLSLDELAWVEKPAINISNLIEQLNAYKQPANEQAALACFQTHKQSLATMNLDQRMDYEEKLYASLIYNDRPALLVFADASDYFGWTNNISWIKASQSKWSKQRFDALSQLSIIYQRVCQRYNPYFQVSHDTPTKPYRRITTHHHHLLAQEQREEWFCLCQSANLSELQTYFSEEPLRRPLYIIDILFGAGVSYWALMQTLLDQSFNYPFLIEHYDTSVFAISLIAMVSGLLLAGLLLVWRSLNLNISTGTKWTVACVTIILTTKMSEDVGIFVIIAIFAGLILNILYSWSIKLETITAAIVDRIARLPLIHKSISTQTTHSKKTAPITMNKQIYPLLIAQFLSAFADNAILFTVIAMVMKAATEQPSWYIPALQSAFLIAYVLLGPWVGSFADRHPKARVLMIGNVIKAVGAGLLLIGVEPLLAYGIVGIGAAIYSPAKYGILPELVGHDVLVKANSWIEGSTIFAILLGMKIGAEVADHSTSMALLGTVVLFIVSALATLSLPVKISKKENTDNALVEFGKQMALFFTTPRSFFAVLGGSLFWAAAASLRVILIAWAPLVLMSKNASEIADLTLYLTVGIIGGSIIVPRLIPLEYLRRARIPAYLMAVLISLLSFTNHVISAQAVLFLIGMMGGMFIVPINAALQEQGQQTIGSGSAVALQNFFQNLAMLLAVGTYTLAASQQVNPVAAMFALGVIVFIATFLVSLRLPENQ